MIKQISKAIEELLFLHINYGLGYEHMEYTEIHDKQITKKQHYVPKSYLRNFAIDNQKSQQVYALFSGNEEAKVVSINDICCQTFLYDQIAIDPDSGTQVFVAPNEIENSFINLEGQYVSIISKIEENLADSNLISVTDEEIEILKQFISVLLFRNPLFVHIIKCSIDRMYAKNQDYLNYIEEILPGIPQSVFISFLANEFLKQFILPDKGIYTRAMKDTMNHSQLCLFRAQDNSRFITSAMPVVNIYGEKDGVEYDLLGMPITPDLFLAIIDIDYCLPNVISIDDYSVMRINSLQVLGERKILIANQKKFFSDVDPSFTWDKGDDSWLFKMLGRDKDEVVSLYKETMDTKNTKYCKIP